MTEKEAIYSYLGDPNEQSFNVEEYTGSYGGLINVLGLRHKGLIISGNTLYRRVQEHFNVELDRWEFLHELGLWSIQYVGVNVLRIGKQEIIRGQLKQGSSTYYCVPPNPEVEEELKEA